MSLVINSLVPYISQFKHQYSGNYVLVLYENNILKNNHVIYKSVIPIKSFNNTTNNIKSYIINKSVAINNRDNVVMARIFQHKNHFIKLIFTGLIDLKKRMALMYSTISNPVHYKNDLNYFSEHFFNIKFDISGTCKIIYSFTNNRIQSTDIKTNILYPGRHGMHYDTFYRQYYKPENNIHNKSTNKIVHDNNKLLQKNYEKYTNTTIYSPCTSIVITINNKKYIKNSYQGLNPHLNIKFVTFHITPINQIKYYYYSPFVCEIKNIMITGNFMVLHCESEHYMKISDERKEMERYLYDQSRHHNQGIGISSRYYNDNTIINSDSTPFKFIMLFYNDNPSKNWTNKLKYKKHNFLNYMSNSDDFVKIKNANDLLFTSDEQLNVVCMYNNDIKLIPSNINVPKKYYEKGALGYLT